MVGTRHRLSWLKESIFVKLLGVLLTAGVVINFLVLATFRHHSPARGESPVVKNVRRYADFLVHDIAHNDNFRHAQEISRELGLDFRVEGTGWSWSSAEGLPTVTEALALHRQADGSGGFLHCHHRPCLLVDGRFASGPAKVLVLLPQPPPHEVPWSTILSLVGSFSLIIVLSFFLIHWILQPLSSLTEAVGKVSSGDFDVTIEYTGSDELGRLATAFNAMTKRLKEILQRQRQLLIDVSHELRSPLARARVAVEFVPDEGIRKEVTEEIDEMGRLLHELLEDARMESGANHLQLEQTESHATSEGDG